MSGLQAKRAIVVGGASGIGRAIADKLADDGAHVVVADLDGDRATAAAAELERAGGRAVAVRCDMANEPDVVALVEATIAAFGGVDVLVNSAGLTSWAVMQRDLPVAAADVDVWSRTMAVNLLGPMLCCKHVVPHMIEAGGGSIVNVSSVRSLEGSAIMNAYAASKAGLNILTRCIATAFGKQGVRCNALLPGTLLTPATQPLADHDEGFFERLADVQLIPELARPEDVAEVAAFLASARSVALQGQLLVVDGGASAHQRMPAPRLGPGRG